MSNTSVTLLNVRLSYVHLVKPYSNDPSMEAKYSCTILLPKTDLQGKAAIDAAIEAAKQAGLQKKFGGVLPPKLPVPVYDGDGFTASGNKFGPECAGCWVFTASSAADKPVEIVDRNMNRILDATQVYSGMYANINVNFFPYAAPGHKGIGCGLGPVQKVRDGEALGGSAPAASSCFSAMGDEQPVRINPVTGLPM